MLTPLHVLPAALPDGVASTAAVTLMLSGGVVYVWGLRRAAGRRPSLIGGVRRVGPARVGALVAGAVVILVALSPPMDAAAQQRFSAHMVQHMLLIVVAAPLLAAASGLPLLLVLPPRGRRTVTAVRHRLRHTPGIALLFLPITAWLAQVLVLWGWHLPAAYDAAVQSDPVHLAEHATFLLVSWAFWWHVLQPGPRRVAGPAAVAYVVAATLPASALGAVLTFAPAPLYPLQAALSAASGTDPLVDQQLAGLVMWIPMDLLFLAMTVSLFLPWLTRLATAEEETPLVAPPVPYATTGRQR